jgi:hypothetical protein
LGKLRRAELSEVGISKDKISKLKEKLKEVRDEYKNKKGE